MRRGLMGRNEAELPVAAIEARLAKLRTEMDAAGLDAFVVYTNNVRPSAVTWLTGFTPYWSDALLLVQQTGAPAFATALSKRVSEWIRTTDPVSEIVNTPKPGALIGERLKTDPLIRRVGVLEYDTLPAGLADDLTSAAPAVEWIDGTALFAGLRREIDSTERGLLARADAIAVAALCEAESGKAHDAGTLAGLIEQSARLAGAEEAYIAVAPDLDADRRLNRTSKPTPLADRFAVRASIAYKGCWVRRTRTFAKDGSAAQADAWFKNTIQSIEPGKPIAAQLAEKLKGLPGATLDSWMAESCTGSYPLSVIASSRTSANMTPLSGQFLVFSVELTIDQAPWIGGAPLIVGQNTL
ncbi:aminopeptidase P family N-terminal domain-containing protein [Rhodoplanes sp. Z2-YC6860]|uniref:aminopeptidase P family N-terminal domain-containing protein n=1 Tax=Rhodoplanes sp. Z2-YC6860 TaxID=674703 RepID=UPI00078CF115|nr:aminopeptidase P family N-terminal domain-containing protein [Rhodoplanes sp. Z2-YC6860]AMN39511.1 Xaa-Pro aminopeptidase [Rhodoplanes sp. Z2-YC6860]